MLDLSTKQNADVALCRGVFANVLGATALLMKIVIFCVSLHGIIVRIMIRKIVEIE